jgi:hypothetical protein
VKEFEKEITSGAHKFAEQAARDNEHILAGMLEFQSFLF